MTGMQSQHHSLPIGLLVLNSYYICVFMCSYLSLDILERLRQLHVSTRAHMFISTWHFPICKVFRGPSSSSSSSSLSCSYPTQVSIIHPISSPPTLSTEATRSSANKSYKFGNYYSYSLGFMTGVPINISPSFSLPPFLHTHTHIQ